jgi:lipoprotein-anchoring transpeptidase ErfK/SrfK
VVFDNRLFIPPVGTTNRRIFGELGSFALDLGGGYMIHGTPDQTSVGEKSTHGCIRLRDEDLMWLFDNVPVGTPVLIH